MSNWNDIAAWKKFLNTFTVVFIAIDVIFIVLGILFATGLVEADIVLDVFGASPDQLAGTSAAAFATVIGVSFVISYAVNLICLLFVRRGVKDPSKMTVGMVLFGILSALSLINLVSTIAGGSGFSNILTVLCTTILNCGVFAGCYKVRAAAKN